jgi:HK97 family phage major capsid protein
VRNTSYAKKDASGEASFEPQVVEDVKRELKTYNDNHLTNYKKLKDRYEELKEALKTQEKDKDALLEEKITKLSEDILTRQNAIDSDFAKKAKLEEETKSIHERIDDFEVAMKRLGKVSDEVSPEVKEKLEAEVTELDFSLKAVKNENGARYDVTKKGEKIISLDDYKHYKNGLEIYVRKGDSQSFVFTPEELKAIRIGHDPDLGYTVTPAMSNRIVTRLFEMDPIRQLAASETITTSSLKFGVDYDEAGFGWEDETVPGGDTTTARIGQKEIPVHTMYAKILATQNLLEDSSINVERWIANKTADKFNRAEGSAFVLGDGNRKPTGFLTYPDNPTETPVYGKIKQINLGAPAAITADGLMNMKYNLIEQYLSRGTWLMNRLTVLEIMKLKNGQGDYIWKAGLTEDSQSTLLGLPVRMSTSMPLVAADALSIALADWPETYLIVDRLGISLLRDPYTKKPLVEFYNRKRCGADVINYQSIRLGKVAA